MAGVLDQELAQLCGEHGSEVGMVGTDDAFAGAQGLVGQEHVEHHPRAGSAQSLLPEPVGESGWVEA